MKKVILFLTGSLLFFACTSSQYTVSTYVPKETTDLAQYKTFAYMDMTKGLSLTPQMLSVVLVAQSAISNEMQIRGFSPVKEGIQPDILINMGTFTDIKTEYVANSIAFYPEQNPLYWGTVDYDWRYANVSYATTVGVDVYKEGTLLVDIVDAKNKVLLWHGSVTRVLQNGNNEGKEKNISIAISTLFQKFPVKPIENSKR